MERVVSPFKKAAFAVTALVIFLFLTLGAAEILLRIVPQVKDACRGASLDGELQNPVEKVLVLGDSFLTPLGNGTTLYEYFEVLLEGRGIQVLNTAKPGYGPLDYWVQLQGFAPGFKPDRVILFYYTGNDLTNMQYRTGFKQNVKAAVKPWLTRSALYNFLEFVRNRMDDMRIRNKDMGQAGVAEEKINFAREQKISPYLLELSRVHPNYVLDNLLVREEENQQAWQEGRRLLERIAAYCRKRGIMFNLVMIPSTAQVNYSHFDFYRNLGFRVSDETLRTSVPQQLMEKYCLENQIECIDLLPDFRARSNEEFYLNNDDHLNAAGAELAAQKSFERIF